MESIRAKINTLKEDIAELAQSERVALERTEELTRANKSAAQIMSQLESTSFQITKTQELIDSTASNVEELTSSDEELLQIQSTYEDSVQRVQDLIVHEEQRHSQAKRDMESTRRDRDGLIAKQGQLKAEKEQYERQLARREELIKEAGIRHNIRGYNISDLDEGQIQEFMKKLEKLSRDQNSLLEKAKVSHWILLTYEMC